MDVELGEERRGEERSRGFALSANFATLQIEIAALSRKICRFAFTRRRVSDLSVACGGGGGIAIATWHGTRHGCLVASNDDATRQRAREAREGGENSVPCIQIVAPFQTTRRTSYVRHASISTFSSAAT